MLNEGSARIPSRGGSSVFPEIILGIPSVILSGIFQRKVVQILFHDFSTDFSSDFSLKNTTDHFCGFFFRNSFKKFFKDCFKSLTMILCWRFWDRMSKYRTSNVETSKADNFEQQFRNYALFRGRGRFNIHIVDYLFSQTRINLPRMFRLLTKFWHLKFCHATMYKCYIRTSATTKRKINQKKKRIKIRFLQVFLQ